MSGSVLYTLEELVDSGLIQLGRGNVISKKDIAASPGIYPIYSSAKENDGKFGEYGKFMFDEELITWSVDGGGRLFHRKKHKYSVTNVGGTLRILNPTVLNYRYLYYVLTARHAEIAFDWVLKAHPSTIKKLYKDIPVPALVEQHRIVAILDKSFDGIATAKANAEKNLQNAHALFDSALNEIYTNLNQCSWRHLDEIVEPDSRITYGVVKPGEEGEVPFVRGGDIVRGSIRIDQLRTIAQHVSDQYKRTLLRGGELLICLVGLPGQVAVAPKTLAGANIARQVGLIRLSRFANSEFVRFYLQSPAGLKSLLSRRTGSVQQVINLEELRKVLIPMPDLDQQEIVVDKCFLLEENFRNLVTATQQKIALLDGLKKSILYQAFSGSL